MLANLLSLLLGIAFALGAIGCGATAVRAWREQHHFAIIGVGMAGVAAAGCAMGFLGLAFGLFV